MNKNETIALSKANWFVITACEDEICLTGKNTEKEAEEMLMDRFQKALPEELTMEYLETVYENMKENMEEGKYVDREEFEEISNRYYDTVNHNFNYDNAYFDGKMAYYMPEKTSGFDCSMVGAVCSRNEFHGRYIVFWNDESETYHADFNVKDEAVQKLRELFLETVPAEKLKDPAFIKSVANMNLDETDLGFIDDIAFNTGNTHFFNAMISDIAVA